MAAPRRALSGEPRGERDRQALSGEHAWERWFAWWHGLYAAVFAAACAIVLADGSLTFSRKAGALALMATLVGLFLLVGLPALRSHDDRRGLIYVVGIVVLFTPAYLLAPQVGTLLFILCPHCFMVAAPRERTALLAVAALCATPAVTIMAEQGWRPRAIGATLAGSAAIFLFSAMFGTFIIRIIGQSHERAELIEQLDATRAELAELSHDAGALAERERLAGEIHDTLAQGFTSILMLLQAAESAVDGDPPAVRRHLALAQRTARENLAEARALVAALAPAQLEGKPLPEALRRIVDGLGDEAGLRASFEVSGTPRQLPAGIEVVLLRATQEALANIRKHAGARSVDVRLSYDGKAPTLAVRDDGCGFDHGRADGYGLRGMRSRVEQVGGTVEVTSTPGEGTCVEVCLP